MIGTLLRLASFLFIARAIMSWIPIKEDSALRPVADFVYRATEPVLAPIRRALPPMGGLDLSIIIVIVGINILAGIIG